MSVQAEQQFGVSFVSESEVPEAPRTTERNDALWEFVKNLLIATPNQFARVKEFKSATGAGQKASQINNGRNKKFAPTPEGSYEARFEVKKGEGPNDDTSILYMRYVPVQ